MDKVIQERWTESYVSPITIDQHVNGLLGNSRGRFQTCIVFNVTELCFYTASLDWQHHPKLFRLGPSLLIPTGLRHASEEPPTFPLLRTTPKDLDDSLIT